MWSLIFKDLNLLAISIALASVVLFLALIMYRRKIGNLIDRISPKSDADAQPVVPQKAEINSFGVAPNIVPESKHAAALATRILNDIEKAPISGEEKVRSACVLAANFILRAEFEVKYRIIFKSQMEALSGLRQKGPHSLDQYYQIYLTRVEERKSEVIAIGLKTSFEAWVNFIAGSNLPYVEIEGGIARITERGDAFMEFTVRAGPFNHIL